ncbi:MAG: FAD-binding protein, partial [Slackia sp.]
MEERKLSRRAFLGTAGAATELAALASLGGCAPKTGGAEQAATESVASNGAMQTTDPSKAVWPVVEEIEVGAAGEGEIAFMAEPIAESDIVATHDVDVVVCGLGPAGDAAALSCAEHGLKTVAVEKQSTGNYNSATIGGTNSKLHQHWGMTYDTDAWIADAMVDCAFQGDMSLYRHFLEKNGEAVDWYVGHFDNQN